MANPNVRRSSFKNPQVQEELRNLVPQDVFRGSYSEYNLTNMTRLSGNSLRGSLPKRSGSSNIPTPSFRRIPGQNSSVTRNVSYMAPRSKVASTGPNSTSRPPRGSSVPRGSGSAISIKSNNLQKPQNSGRATTSFSALNNTRRRSKSHESLSLLQTPAFTPSIRSRSKSPGGMSTSRTPWRRGVHNEAGEIGKSITITKDRKVLSEMAKFVFEFLESQNCQARPPDWKELVNPTKIPVAKFMAMVKFLASHFVGETFFAKPEDDAEKIMELFKILKYPGTLPKSHLKTPTVQHAWPGCFTFLSWLCCKTQALLTPPTERSNIDELNTGLQEFAFESYLNLFPLHFRNEILPEHVDAEVENFKFRVRDSHATELTKTKEELIDEKAERLVELEMLNGEVDPSKDIKERLAAETEVQTTLQGRIREAENDCKKYADCNHLKLQNERILMEINARTTELSRIKQQVADQSLSKQEAHAMHNETAGLRNQLKTIRHVNANLEKESQARCKKLEEFQIEFYDLCKRFDIVEKYNENLRFLKLDDHSIAPNPFSPKELEEWMKVVGKNLRRSESRVNEMVKEVDLSSEQKEKENQEFIAHMIKLKKDMDDLNQKLEAVKKYSGFISQDHEKKHSVVQSRLDDINEVLRLEEENFNKAQSANDAAYENLNAWKASLEEYRNTAEEWNRKLESGLADYLQYNSERKMSLNNIVTESAQNQREFYITHFNVDIFEGLGDLVPSRDKGKKKK